MTKSIVGPVITLASQVKEMIETSDPDYTPTVIQTEYGIFYVAKIEIAFVANEQLDNPELVGTLVPFDTHSGLAMSYDFVPVPPEDVPKFYKDIE